MYFQCFVIYVLRGWYTFDRKVFLALIGLVIAGTAHLSLQAGGRGKDTIFLKWHTPRCPGFPSKICCYTVLKWSCNRAVSVSVLYLFRNKNYVYQPVSLTTYT